MRKKLMAILLLISAIVLMATACVNGTVLYTNVIFDSITVAYWEPIDEDGNIDIDKPVIENQQIENVVGNGKMPMHMYSYIGLKWNKSESNKYEFTVITFAITVSIDTKFEIAISGTDTAAEDVISTHTLDCKADVPNGIALALERITSDGAFSNRISIVNLKPEQSKINWRISDVQIGGVEK